jgi:hypothetical protein
VAAAIARADAARTAARKAAAFRELDAVYRADAAAIREDLRAFDGDTQQILGSDGQLRQEQHSGLRESRSRDEDALVAEWRSPRRARRYNRPSNQLIVTRKQFEYFVSTGKYFDAELCQRQLRAAEESEAQGARHRMEVDFVAVKRLLKMRHDNRAEQLEYALDTNTRFLGRTRAAEREVLENVEKKIHAKGQRHSEPEKAWNFTRPARMNDISKKIRQQPIVVPPGSREAVRAQGRFERQAVPIRLPPLDFDRLSETRLRIGVKWAIP